MTDKDDLHHAVDELDEATAHEALAYLQHLRLLRVLREAPIDDEPETEEEPAAVAEEAIARGDVISDEDLERELRQG